MLNKRKKRNYIFPIKHIPSKRIFDILFSLFSIFLLSPVFILISLLIFFTSKGTIIYKSLRLGRGGKIIGCYKFRTMYKDADKKLQNILIKDSELNKEWQLFQKLKKDPRITPIGSFLRKSSLDELPQFFNVLKGDMSIVGPRAFVLMGPKENFHLEIQLYLKDKTQKILSIRPGITGLWQISGRSEISIQERILIDESYIDKRNFFFDVYLILKTIPIIFFSKGAY